MTNATTNNIISYIVPQTCTIHLREGKIKIKAMKFVSWKRLKKKTLLVSNLQHECIALQRFKVNNLIFEFIT